MRFGCRYAQVIYDEDDGEMNQPDDVGLEFPGAADGDYETGAGVLTGDQTTKNKSRSCPDLVPCPAPPAPGRHA